MNGWMWLAVGLTVWLVLIVLVLLWAAGARDGNEQFDRVMNERFDR